VVIVIFRSRLRYPCSEEYLRTAQRMHDLAAAMPGFLSIKTFTAQDGERVSLVEFESEEALAAWREHPEHRRAQQRGREAFYSEYQIQVCQPHRAYSFVAGAAEEQP
jgi:heme-degrading monooxygenase HmoA